MIDTGVLKQAPGSIEDDAQNRIAAVYAYHQRSKHRLDGYAAGPETLDWDAQPNPFRTYADTETLPLALDKLPASISYSAAINGSASAHEFSLQALAQLLRLAFGLTAWKQFGTERWALRANPSSGNLHPTEVWVMVRGWEELNDGLYHYDAYAHALQRRSKWLSADVSAQPGLHIALSSVYWREAWKYGERAFRYCHLDIGHAAAALGFASAALGWRALAVEPNEPAALDNLLGLQRPEHQSVEVESAQCLFRIKAIETNRKAEMSPNSAWTSLVQSAKSGAWQGIPNRLDPQPTYTWPAIAQIAAATHVLSNRASVAAVSPEGSLAQASSYAHSAESIVSSRRSAQAYDATQAITRAQFLELLYAFFETRWQPLAMHEVHLVIGVHRVNAMQPGIYVLPRALAGEALLRTQLQRWGEWEATEITIEQRALYRLKIANVQRALATLCCQQRIAGDSAVVFGFLAQFDAPLQQRGASAYPELFWQAGALAHAAYLRATALNIAATGIGCFFDDAWHELLGIDGTALQFLYHLAVGVPLRDDRLVQLSGYFHLRARQDN